MKSIFYLWCFFIPFSHAPSYIHPLISFPALTTSLIIFLTFTMLKRKNKSKDYILIFVAIFFITLLLQLVSLGNIHTKYFSFFIAYLWFFLAYTSLNYYSNNLNLNLNLAVKLLFVTVLVTFMYQIVELLSYINNWDIVNFLPRYDREKYRYSSTLFFYRTRAFSYESANLASYYNIVIPLLLLHFRGFSTRILIFSIWIFGILLTLSSLHISLMLVFFVIMLVSILLRIISTKKINFWLIPLFVVIFLISIYLINHNYENILKVFELITAKASSFLTGVGSASGTIRNNLFILGLSNLSDKPILGYGFAGFYLFGETGLNNFYLHLLVQTGLFIGSLLIILLFILNYKIIKTKNIYLIFPLSVSLITLFFIGDFWLPQLFLPIVFYNLYIKRYKNTYKE